MEGAVTDHPPTRIGPCEFGQLGNWITVRCPRELEPLMRQDRWSMGARQLPADRTAVESSR